MKDLSFEEQGSPFRKPDVIANGKYSISSSSNHFWKHYVKGIDGFEIFGLCGKLENLEMYY